MCKQGRAVHKLGLWGQMGGNRKLTLCVPPGSRDDTAAQRRSLLLKIPLPLSWEMMDVDMTANWNHRYQENMQRLKRGDLLEVAKVVKSLLLRDSRRGLSTGERKMLHSAKQILISELSLSRDISYEEAEDRINQVLHA